MAQEKIYPSGGHHAKDSGAVANGYTEFELMSKFRNKIVANAKLIGLAIATDDDKETNSQYQGRIRQELKSGDVVSDFHLDSYNGKASGVTVFISNNAGADSKAMAQDYSKAFSTIMNIPNRGVKTEGQSQHPKLGILNMRGSAVLVECGFIDNKTDIDAFIKNMDILSWVAVAIMLKYDRNQLKDLGR